MKKYKKSEVKERNECSQQWCCSTRIIRFSETSRQHYAEIALETMQKRGHSITTVY